MRIILVILTTSPLLALSACSLSPIRETEYAPPGFVNGTHILAEARGSYTREDILHPQSDWSHIDAWHEALLSVGFTDADIKDGSEIGANTYMYGHNSVAWYRHQGDYAAHVPPDLQAKLNVYVMNHRRVRERGDIVEIELVESPSKRLVGTVVAIYRPYDDWGSCRWERLDYKGLAELSPYGPPAGRWLECDGLEKDGWLKRPVAGAPPGTGDNFVREWIKLPTLPKAGTSGQ